MYMYMSMNLQACRCDLHGAQLAIAQSQRYYAGNLLVSHVRFRCAIITISTHLVMLSRHFRTVTGVFNFSKLMYSLTHFPLLFLFGLRGRFVARVERGSSGSFYYSFTLS